MSEFITWRVLALPFFFLLLVLFGNPACEGVSETDSHRDHILLITVDTLRPDYLGLYGQEAETSPFLDSLLSQGIVFDAAKSPIARTTQALASLFTGQYPHEHGVRKLLDTLPDDQKTVAQYAQENGYKTIAVVSNHVLRPERGLDAGFDIYDFANDARIAQKTTEAALSHIRGHAATEKVFLWVHYIDPHAPYFPPAKYANTFDPNYWGPYRYRFGSQQGGTGDRAYPRNLGKVRAVYQNALGDRVNAHIQKLYAADIRATDDAIKQLMQGLQDLMGDNWTIVFAADHGEALGEHHVFYDHGDYVYEEEVAVPLAIVLPETDSASLRGRTSVDVSLVDLGPTLVELMGGSMKEAMGSEISGRSLLPLMIGESILDRPVFSESGVAYQWPQIRKRKHFSVSGRFRSVTHRGWKLIWTPGADPEETFELFDLASDAKEQNNLYDPDHPEGRRLRSLLRDWVEQGKSARIDIGEQSPPTQKDEELLRSLGYVE